MKPMLTCSKALKDGCIGEDMKGYEDVIRLKHPEYNDDQVTNTVSNGLPGFALNRIRNGKAYLLSNNKTLIPYAGMPIFLIDINGKAKPNKWGYDIFKFQIYFSSKDNPNISLLPHGSTSEPKGRTTLEMINLMKK